MLQLLYGSALSLKCTLQTSCSTEFPGHQPYFMLAIFAFAAQEVTCWIAYFILRCSSKTKGHKSLGGLDPLVKRALTPTEKKKEQASDDASTQCKLCCGMRCFTTKARGGGYLRALMIWDIIACAICVGIFYLSVTA